MRIGMVSLRRTVGACDIGWDFASKDIRRPATYVKRARMAKQELAEAAEVATNAHDDKNRPPILSEARDAVSKRFGADFARALVLDNPAAIVAGQPLPIPRHAPTRDTETKERVKNDRGRRGPSAS